MKKLLFLTLSALLALSMLAGCSSPAPAETDPAVETNPRRRRDHPGGRRSQRAYPAGLLRRGHEGPLC